MRRSILFAALALGAQAAWAQDVTDPMSPDTGVVVEDPMGTDGAVDPGTDVVVDETDPGTDVVVDETDRAPTWSSTRPTRAPTWS